jgi:hypothetical protein
MNIEQEIEHLKFLSRRMTFMKIRGNNRYAYVKVKEQLDELLEKLKGEDNE